MKSYLRLFIIAALIIITDQVSKHWILENLTEGTYWLDSETHPPITIIEGFFYIVHIQNKGAAWGMFAGMGRVFAALGFFALFAIYYFRKALFLDRHRMQVAFGLMTGGIIGNMIDRIRFNQVVDFLDFHLPIYGRYPSFNVADCGITIGVGLYIIFSFILERAEKKKAEATQAIEPQQNTR